MKVLHRIGGLPRTLREVNYSLALLSNFRGIGWHRSMRGGIPVDSSGEPIPWISYPAVHWLELNMKRESRVFEFGAGHSTLWFAKRARLVISVDHDSGWVEHLRRSLPANTRVELRALRTEAVHTLPSPYVAAIREFGDEAFDIILIDGELRGACAESAMTMLAPTGFIVFDNSDRPEHLDALKAFTQRGFARVDFIGPVPGFGHLGCTSVFFRSGASAMTPDAYPPFLGY